MKVIIVGLIALMSVQSFANTSINDLFDGKQSLGMSIYCKDPTSGRVNLHVGGIILEKTDQNHAYGFLTSWIPPKEAFTAVGFNGVRYTETQDEYLKQQLDSVDEVATKSPYAMAKLTNAGSVVEIDTPRLLGVIKKNENNEYQIKVKDREPNCKGHFCKMDCEVTSIIKL